MRVYFPKIALVIAYLFKIQAHIYKLYYITFISFKQVLNEKIRFYNVFFTVSNQKIYIIREIEHYIVQKVQKVSKL